MTDVFNINYSNLFGGERTARPNRMLRAAQKQEALALPASYQEIPEEEMYYIDGGRSLFVDGMPSWMVSAPLDGIFLACGLGIAWAPIKLLGKTFGKKLATKFISKFGFNIVGNLLKAINFVSGVAINVSTGAIMNTITNNWWNFTSLGGIVAFSADIATDGRSDGWISW